MKNQSIALTIFIIFSIFTITFGQFLPFEFSSRSFAFYYYTAVLFVLPIGIGIKVYEGFSKQESHTARATGSIVLGFVTFFIMIVIWFAHGMCGYITDTTIVKKGSIIPTSIVERHYDCGATDSGPAKYEYVSITPIIPFLVNYVITVDTTKIDKQLLKKIHQ